MKRERSINLQSQSSACNYGRVVETQLPFLSYVVIYLYLSYVADMPQGFTFTFVARCVTVPRRASINASHAQLDRRNALLCLAELR